MSKTLSSKTLDLLPDDLDEALVIVIGNSDQTCAITKGQRIMEHYIYEALNRNSKAMGDFFHLLLDAHLGRR